MSANTRSASAAAACVLVAVTLAGCQPTDDPSAPYTCMDQTYSPINGAPYVENDCW